MRLKKIITIVLSLFIAISLVYLITNEIDSSQNNTSKNSNQANFTDVSGEIIKREDKIINVYYFFTEFRCHTCLTIEKYTAEAVKKGFKNEIANGKIQWRPLNIEKSENEHFKDDFKLHTKSVIVEEEGKKKRLRWKNLEKIWELVRDKEGFIKYIQDEVTKYLRST